MRRLIFVVCLALASTSISFAATSTPVGEAVKGFQDLFSPHLPAAAATVGNESIDRDTKVLRLQVDSLCREIQVAAALAIAASRAKSEDAKQRSAQSAMHTVTKLEAGGGQLLEPIAQRQSFVPPADVLAAGQRMIQALRQHVDELGVSAMVAPPPGQARGSLAAVTASERLSLADLQTLPAAEVEKQLPDKHPSAFYQYAGFLFREGRKDDAVMWFYVGQLRYRFLLQAVPPKDPSGDPAIFASLNSSLGKMINEYAGGDPPRWAEQLQKALDWDDAHPNRYTSKEQFSVIHANVREGALNLKAAIETGADSLRAEREKRGLENRD